MRPRPHHQQIGRAGIVLLDRRVGVKRPHRVFGIEPAADVEHSAFHVVHKAPQRARLPELIVVRVVNDLLPVSGLAVEKLLIDFGKRAEMQKEVVAIGRTGIEKLPLFRRLRPALARQEERVEIKIRRQH